MQLSYKLQISFAWVLSLLCMPHPKEPKMHQTMCKGCYGWYKCTQMGYFFSQTHPKLLNLSWTFFCSLHKNNENGSKQAMSKNQQPQQMTQSNTCLVHTRRPPIKIWHTSKQEKKTPFAYIILWYNIPRCDVVLCGITNSIHKYNHDANKYLSHE